jgi:hypothetical protein
MPAGAYGLIAPARSPGAPRLIARAFAASCWIGRWEIAAADRQRRMPVCPME